MDQKMSETRLARTSTSKLDSRSWVLKPSYKMEQELHRDYLKT